MNRSRSLFLSVSLVVLLPIATGVLWSAVSASRDDDAGDSLYKYLSIFSETFSLVRSSYVDATDSDALVGGALEGVTDALDSFSNLVPAGALAGYERGQDLGWRRSGLRLAHDRGLTFVLGVEPGSPAATAELERGDVLATVNGVETRSLPTWKIEETLAGDPGSKVELRILRRGETEERSLVLADSPPPAPAVDRVRGVPVLRFGRLRTEELEALRGLLGGLTERGETKLVVDLRGASFGDIPAAYEIGGLFAGGNLGKLSEQGKVLREFDSTSAPLWHGEVVVLTDGGTLGAGEVLAAILRDGAGARLVGAPTFGWAGERTYLELSGGARLHLTTAFYSGPNGEALSKELAPDVVVDELSRTFGDADRPLDELILDRGIDLLLGESDATPHAA